MASSSTSENAIAVQRTGTGNRKPWEPQGARTRATCLLALLPTWTKVFPRRAVPPASDSSATGLLLLIFVAFRAEGAEPVVPTEAFKSSKFFSAKSKTNTSRAAIVERPFRKSLSVLQDETFAEEVFWETFALAMYWVKTHHTHLTPVVHRSGRPLFQRSDV